MKYCVLLLHCSYLSSTVCAQWLGSLYSSRFASLLNKSWQHAWAFSAFLQPEKLQQVYHFLFIITYTPPSLIQHGSHIICVHKNWILSSVLKQKLNINALLCGFYSVVGVFLKNLQFWNMKALLDDLFLDFDGLLDFSWDFHSPLISCDPVYYQPV